MKSIKTRECSTSTSLFGARLRHWGNSIWQQSRHPQTYAKAAVEFQKDDGGDVRNVSGTRRIFTIGNTEVMIRPVEENDAIDLYRTILRSRRELQQTDPTFGDSVTSLGSVMTDVDRNILHMKAGLSLPFVILANGTLAGEVGLICIDKEKSIGYIGYWLSPLFQGYGIMTQCVGELADIAFQTLGLDHLDITTRKRNIASQKVAGRLGFSKQEGIPDGVRGLADRFTRGLISFGNVEYQIFTLSSVNASTDAATQRRPYFFQREMKKILSPKRDDNDDEHIFSKRI